MSRSEYTAWINAHVPTDPTGQCDAATKAMVAAFPELTRVRGHYRWSQHEPAWPHWWLVTADGTIIDPTAAQWPDHGLGGVYEPHDESGPEPTGKCPNCGGYCYEGNFCCTENCEIAYRAYIMGELR